MKRKEKTTTNTRKLVYFLGIGIETEKVFAAPEVVQFTQSLKKSEARRKGGRAKERAYRKGSTVSHLDLGTLAFLQTTNSLIQDSTDKSFSFTGEVVKQSYSYVKFDQALQLRSRVYTVYKLFLKKKKLKA